MSYSDKRAKVGKPHPAPAAALEQHYRFADLKRLGIVQTWPTLYAWMRLPGREQDFIALPHLVRERGSLLARRSNH